MGLTTDGLPKYLQELRRQMLKARLLGGYLGHFYALKTKNASNEHAHGRVEKSFFLRSIN